MLIDIEKLKATKLNNGYRFIDDRGGVCAVQAFKDALVRPVFNHSLPRELFTLEIEMVNHYETFRAEPEEEFSNEIMSKLVAIAEEVNKEHYASNINHSE